MSAEAGGGRREARANTTHAADALATCRKDIERIDSEVVRLLGERVRIGREIGTLKRSLGLPTIDPAREAEVIRHAGELARDAGLLDEPVRAIFWQIIGLSRRAQVDE
jgi:chorismate mutase